ncbi:putative GCN5-related N-acetyltransferase [Candidatus Jidaibacter acanthamoeba]|uniref:Putative GCN5-related N-acetyltransferase n=1 Tax=Candidatus Jidaibacter acanthamoebae TaxID=86105 RepID=A0A0C1QY24_9RICK|nr:GNAT family N-acetyltransferase [Candidatus Jidaibacter acanthamoeba]KIE04940.1 putative GCN5-related N-acetyltransferase [Candidatus Jidaibacter acanthamoeba]
MEYKLIVQDSENSEITEILKQGVRSYSSAYFNGVVGGDSFVIYTQNKEGKVIGGISGNLGRYAKVAWAWVDEEYRSQKLGTKLFNELDKFAKSKGSRYILLETFEFQAKPFYEKIGYECIGTVKRLIEGYDCHFMRKEL